jgi:hypothetical protein
MCRCAAGPGQRRLGRVNALDRFANITGSVAA